MPSSFSLTAALVTALLVFDQTTFANPVPQQSNSPALSLLTRNDENYVGCSDKQKKKLKKDFEDAEKLAEYADGIDTKSKAWSHYFRTTGDGQTEDLKYAKSQWKLIANYDDNKYRFSVRCGDDKHVDCKNGKSLAITDAKPQKDDKTPREILICPLYFKDASKETVNDLDKRKFEKPKRGKDNSWCSPGNKFGWYEVGGHTLFHEMTHLHAVGSAAGVPEKEDKDQDGKTFKTSGSWDVMDWHATSYPVNARALAEAWQKGTAKDDWIRPYNSAENLAGAALEWYMTDKCKDSGNPIGDIEL